MSDFQLQIEHHPETHLLQTLRLGPQRSVQVLRLFDRYYLLERNKGERRPPVQLEEPELLTRLATDGRLLAAEVEPLLPPLRSSFDIVLDDNSPESPSLPQTPNSSPLSPSLNSSLSSPALATPAPPPAAADPLQSKLQTAMARFREQNPETAAVLQHHQPVPLPEKPAYDPFKSTYGAHPSLGANAPSEEQSAQISAVLSSQTSVPPPAELAGALRAESSAEPGLETLTQPLVAHALQQASDNQQKLLEQAAQLKREVDKRSERVQSALDRFEAFQERVDELNNRLEHWQSEMERHHFSRDSLLERTAEDLERLQRQLRQILSDGLALQKVLREHRFPDQDQMNDKLACFEDMLDHVVQQRHWVHYLQQQQAFAALERERVEVLVTRRKALQNQLAQLKDAIEQLEQINREILTRDPLAVPEPVPALALHELTRLDYELQMLESDPGLLALEDKDPS